uniref:Glycosyltransferase n=1 Tax=Fagus sylvatica TaxID=28930 RepID=A0A2N9EFL6_FAGSY
MEISKPHAVLLSSPGTGHLIPVLELGNRLVTHHNFTVTIFVVSSHMSPAESQVLQSSLTPKLCDIIELPPVDISGLVEPNAAVVTLLAVMMREVRSSLRSAISAMKQRPTVLIVDLFGTESLSIGDEFDMLKYLYCASNAWFLALTIYVPFLDKLVVGEYVHQKEPLKIPGCNPIQPDDVVDPMLDRTNQQYFEYLRIGTEAVMSDGILVNTWEDLQPTIITALRDKNLLGGIVKVPVHCIGPITRPVSNAKSTDLFDWLDKQPSESVIYVSFGSGGALSYEQMTEVAWGLELSQQRFVWVVRPPTVEAADAAFFTAGKGGDDPLSYLPDGFLTRTQSLGFVVPLWAPQVDVLNHVSVGGFLSHCGWSSTLESITNGVPMIAWPLYAEQKMNATLLTEEIGVAIRSKVLPSKKVVKREEIETMVRKIIEDKNGNGIRAKVKELKYSAEKALSNGGSSHNALSQVEQECKISMQRQKRVSTQLCEPDYACQIGVLS